MSDWIGWIATAIFAVSYFCKRATTLRWVQGIAALVWISYGVVINAPPVILANAIVAALAGYSAWRQYGLGLATSKRCQSVDNPRAARRHDEMRVGTPVVAVINPRAVL